MSIRSMMIFVVMVLMASLALGHGDQKHIVGTVEKINADSVVVKTSDGKSVEVTLTAATVYVRRGGKTAKLPDVAIGDRVVIHATPHGDALEANEVKFAKPGDPAAPLATPGKKP